MKPRRAASSRPLPLTIPDLRFRSQPGPSTAQSTSTSHPLDQPLCILDRHTTASLGNAPDARLHLRLAEQPPAIAGRDAQLLVRGTHGIVLSLQLQLPRLLHFGPVELPGAVDRPVPQVSVAGESQWPRRQRRRMVEKIADQSDSSIRSALAFLGGAGGSR